uniref:Inactive rhomboid protein 1-like n=1 Tax=Phallusia mammillata TaxID=59560 RepID=A0A6F9DQ50_9ASCI|nr:inactive rhomboid protein 1-like [Phallusia mammillata]
MSRNSTSGRNIHNLKLNIPKHGETVDSPREVASAEENASSSGAVTYNRSVSMPANEASNVRHRGPPPPRHRRMQRQSSLLQRTAMIRSGSKRMKEATESFVGIGKNCNEDHEKWRKRHLRYCSMRYGRLKPELEQEVEEGSLSQSTSPSMPQIYDPYARFRGTRYTNSAVGTPEEGEFGPSLGGPIAVSTPPYTPVTPSARSIASMRFAPGMRNTSQRMRKESVARMSWKVLSAVVKGTSVMNNLVSSEHLGADKRSFALPSLAEDDIKESDQEIDTSFLQEMPTIMEDESLADEVFFDQTTTDEYPSKRQISYRRAELVNQIDADESRKHGRKIGVNRVLSNAFHREKRQFGRGLVGRWLNRGLTRKRLNSNVRIQLDQFDNHRPYFTYWITFVHIVVCIISIAVYGIAPIGFTYTKEKFTTTKKSLSRVSEVFEEPQNFWIGPRTKDLIHLGAKYSPCMRLDPKLQEFIKNERLLEKESACCVRNDNSGCIQTNDCPFTFAKWVKWPDFDPPTYGDNFEKRTSGSVCGQDPRYCRSQHSSSTADQWPDDITKWPICSDPLPQEDFQNSSIDNVRCEVVGHPCCIGQEARCEIVTEQYCLYKHGVYHSEASLCSQVNCMQDTCGLIPFRDPEYPDQIYRLWLPVLLHAGLLHCLVSVVFQMTVLRDMEKLAGWHRISIIYVFSGITGNLGSAIFLPYRAEVGPAGSIFGILACLFVEVFQSWQLLKSPLRALFKLVAITTVLFVFGALPWIDNFAHMFGFLAGLLLSFIFLPYITFSKFDKHRKRIQVITCSCLFIGLFVALVFFFYIYPLTDCNGCRYINCIPFTQDFCSNHGFQPEDRQ